MGKRRIRAWLVRVLSRSIGNKHDGEPLSRPRPGSRTEREQELYSQFRLGWSGGYEKGWQDGRTSVLIGAIHTQHSLPAIPAVRAPLRDMPLHQMIERIRPIAPPSPRRTRVLSPLPVSTEEEDEFEAWEDGRFLLDREDITKKRQAFPKTGT